jgi:hypothetical protein
MSCPGEDSRNPHQVAVKSLCATTDECELNHLALGIAGREDAAGTVLDLATTFVGPIPAGEKRASEGLADYHGTEANTKFQIAGVR